MQRFFMKKFPYTFYGGKKTLPFTFKYFPISKKFIPNFCGKNYDLSRKAT